MPARPRPRPRRSIAQRLRSLLWLALWGAVLWWGGGWLWQQPLMDRPRMLWQITRMDPPTALPVPVEGVAARRIADTWGAARDGGARGHEGVDIFAPRGTPVRSSTVGIVTAVRDGGLGGRQVWVLGPARERITTRTWTTGRPACRPATWCSPARCSASWAPPATRRARRRICITASTAPMGR